VHIVVFSQNIVLLMTRFRFVMGAQKFDDERERSVKEPHNFNEEDWQ
jgi:hypothetical protein